MNGALETFAVARRDGALWMEDVALADVAARAGTPTFVYSRAALTMAYRRLAGEMARAHGARPVTICYAVKANSNLAVLNIFARLGAGFDIVSGGELKRVLRAGGDPAKVVFSGLGKTTEEMAFALETGIRCFNLESEPELRRLNDVAVARGRKAPVSLRVNPDVDARTHPYISTGLKQNKFGIAMARAREVYRLAATLPGIAVTGVDCHIGSQLTDAAPLIEAMQKIVALADDLAADGIEVHHVCPGGGVGIVYRDEGAIDIAGYADALAACLGSRRLSLVLEPGRALVGNAGVLLTTVEYVKPGEAKNFLVVDAAMNDLIRPALYQAYHEIVEVRPRGTPPLCVDVVGPICESADVLGVDRQLAAREGDLLAVLSAGAYSFAMSSNYNSRGRAAEAIVDGAAWHLVRRRETFDDLVAGETVLSS